MKGVARWLGILNHQQYHPPKSTSTAPPKGQKTKEVVPSLIWSWRFLQNSPNTWWEDCLGFKHLLKSSSSWWLNQPICKISQIENLPQIGMKIKNSWNHHPVFGILAAKTLLPFCHAFANMWGAKKNLLYTCVQYEAEQLQTLSCWNPMAISRFGQVHRVLTDCNPGFGRHLLIYKELPTHHMLLTFIHVASNPFLTLFHSFTTPKFLKRLNVCSCHLVYPAKNKKTKQTNTTRTPWSRPAARSG